MTHLKPKCSLTAFALLCRCMDGCELLHRPRERKEKEGQISSCPTMNQKARNGLQAASSPQDDHACFPEPPGSPLPLAQPVLLIRQEASWLGWSCSPDSEWSCSWQLDGAAWVAAETHFSILITANECALPLLAWGVWLIMGCTTANWFNQYFDFLTQLACT